MKYSSLIRLSSGGTELQFPASAPASFIAAAAGKTLLEFGRIRCGKFSEAQGLPEKHRIHEANDALSSEIESRTVIPFGCEYEVNRTAVCAGNILQLTTEIRAKNGGAIGDIALETVRFPGKLESCEFLVYGKKTFRSAREYAGEEPVVSLRVRYPGGARAEFCCGDDLWRHRAGLRTQGAVSHYRLAPLEEGGVELTREVLCYEPEAAVEKRPWRFQTLLSWSPAGTPAPAESPAAYEIHNCFASAPERRRFREFIRKASSESNIAALAEPRFCLDAAHTDRTRQKELEHGDLAEYASSWLWANRLLKKSQGDLRFFPGETIWRDSVVMQNMGVAPQALELLEK